MGRLLAFFPGEDFDPQAAADHFGENYFAGPRKAVEVNGQWTSEGFKGSFRLSDGKTTYELICKMRLNRWEVRRQPKTEG